MFIFEEENEKIEYSDVVDTLDDSNNQPIKEENKKTIIEEFGTGKIIFEDEDNKEKIQYSNVVDTLGGFDDDDEDEIIKDKKEENPEEINDENSVKTEENIILSKEDEEKIKKVKSVMEALLLIEKDGLKIRRISHVLKVPYFKVKKYMYELMDEYNSKNGGIVIKREKRGFILVTNPDLSESMKQFIDIKEISLSRVAYETLAIIALNQPITKVEIERIRGISNADAMVNKLRSKKLVRVMGKKSTVGKPRLYGVGMMFFKHFGIKSLKELREYSMQLLELGSLPIDEEKIEEAANISADLLPENDMGEIGIVKPDSMEDLAVEKDFEEDHNDDEDEIMDDDWEE